MEGTLGQTTADADDSAEFALQAGVDIQFMEHWFLNLDLKYVDLDTTITLKSTGKKRKVDVDIDPLILEWG